MEGRLRTIVDEILYGAIERSDRQGYPILVPIWTQGRILINQIENVENREAAIGALAFLAFVAVATPAVVLLSKVMGW